MNRRRRGPRGFALAVVLMIVAISGIVIAYMLDRQANQALGVKRQMDAYTFHHVSRGIQEAVEAWIRSNGTSTVRTALDDEGRAFDLVVDGGQVVHVRFVDAQDGVLADFSGLTGESLDTAIDIVAQLRRNEGEAARGLVRREGPIGVSVNNAPEKVLRAVIGSVLGSTDTGSLVRAIEKARAEGWIDREKMDSVYHDAETPAGDVPRLQGVLAVEPVLWRVIAEAGVPENVWPRPPAVRYGGLAIIAAAGSRNKSAALQRSSSMISWENLSDGQ